MVLEPAPFRSQTSGDTLLLYVKGGMSDVFNIGIGLDHMFSERFSLYCGITTDRSGWKEGINTGVTDWDLYHVNVGSAFRAYGIDWTLGLGYTWGGDDFTLDLGFAESGGSGNVVGRDDYIANMDYNKIKVILGFAFPTVEKEGEGGG